jgi:hypothetical protein
MRREGERVLGRSRRNRSSSIIKSYLEAWVNHVHASTHIMSTTYDHICWAAEYPILWDRGRERWRDSVRTDSLNSRDWFLFFLPSTFYLIPFSSLFVSLFAGTLDNPLSATVSVLKREQAITTPTTGSPQVPHSLSHSFTDPLPFLFILDHGSPGPYRWTWGFRVWPSKYPLLFTERLNTRRKREIRYRPRLSFCRPCRMFSLVRLLFPRIS